MAVAFDPSSVLTCVVLRQGRIVSGPAAMRLSGSPAYEAALKALRELRRGAESVPLSFGLFAAIGALDVHLGLPEGPWTDVFREEELRVPPGRFFWLAEAGEAVPLLVGGVIPPSTILPPERRYEDMDSARVMLEVSITDESQFGNAAQQYWETCETIEEARKPTLVLVPYLLETPLSPTLPLDTLQRHASAMGHALVAEMVFEALDYWYPRLSYSNIR